MIDKGYYQCNPNLETYDAIKCTPVLTSGIKRLSSNSWLDSSTDVDDPTAGKTADALLCKDVALEDYPIIASIQGYSSITPDLYDFYGAKVTNYFTDEFDFFLLSKDRAPYCPESAWLSVDPDMCVGGEVKPVFSDSANAAQIHFKFIQGTAHGGADCIKFEISLVAPGKNCDGQKLHFSSGVYFGSTV